MTTDLTIPPRPPRDADASSWPRHRAKARNKTHNRRRVLAALNQEDNRGTRFCI